MRASSAIGKAEHASERRSAHLLAKDFHFARSARDYCVKPLCSVSIADICDPARVTLRHFCRAPLRYYQ